MPMSIKDPAVSSMAGKLKFILREMGIDLTDPNFVGTPLRWLKYIKHYTQPYSPKEDLAVTFPPKDGEDIFDNAMIVQVGIPYRAMCAHHLLPVLGTAHVGYVPEKRVVGLSKLTRLVHGITHRMPSLQENVCNEITDALMGYLSPLGAMCVISAEHGCMSARGVEEASGCISTATASVKGVFATKHEVRQEFYSLIGVVNV